MKNDRRGFTTVYLTLTALVLIPVVGLAVDFSVLHNVKARLQAAVDAASEDGSRTRTIYVHAAYDVPMLFLRVLGLTTSRVAAQASVKVRFVTLMIVVDRSGSVVNGHTDSSIQSGLNTFVADKTTSVFVDGRDYVGMVSFGGNWKLDYAPSVTFQSGSPDIGTAITNIPFDNSSSTNTADGLWQGYYQLKQLAQTGSLNVIVLLTDGRPSAFSGTFTMNNSPCNSSTKAGWIGANVGSSAADQQDAVGMQGLRPDAGDEQRGVQLREQRE